MKRLRDRKESCRFHGSNFELTLLWNKDALARSCFGIAPDYAYIRKDGENYATIECYSNLKGFSIEAFHIDFGRPDWEVTSKDGDINTMPLEDILKLIPNNAHESN